MTLLNFAHPLTPTQLDQLADLLDRPLDHIVDRRVDFDDQQPYAPQIAALLDGVGWASERWQAGDFVVVLPSLNYIAAGVLAVLHGRMGHFPTVVRLRPVGGSTPRRFEVAELLNLQDIRDDARTNR